MNKLLEVNRPIIKNYASPFRGEGTELNPYVFFEQDIRFNLTVALAAIYAAGTDDGSVFFIYGKHNFRLAYNNGVPDLSDHWANRLVDTLSFATIFPPYSTKLEFSCEVEGSKQKFGCTISDHAKL